MNITRRSALRRTAFVSLAAMGAGFAAATAVAQPSDPPAKPQDYIDARASSLQPDRKVVYKRIDGRELELHAFLPDGWKATDRRPCLLVIHGGGWEKMGPSRMYPFAADFAKRFGMVGISVQYRLYQPAKSVSVFDCVKDARSSMRYLRAHAGEFGIDPDRITAAGGSAGGHLAAATALFDGVDGESDDKSVSCVPNALVLLFPVIDTGPDGYGQEKIGARWRELSPLEHVRAGLPPTILFHGTGDKTTPFAGAKTFHEKMLAAGNHCELIVNDGGGHGYLMQRESLYNETIEKTAEFLDSLGLMEKPATGKP